MSQHYFVMIPLVGFAMYALTRVLVRSPGRALQKKFVGLGTLAGKTKAEIVAVVGPPNAVSAIPGGKSLLQWIATGYHISLIFNGEVCEGVKHQFAAR